MDLVLQPWQLYVVILAGWINHQQQHVVDYLRTEDHVLKEKLGPKRILLNDDQRRRLAVNGKILGRKMLEEVGTLFMPDTSLRWHRTLIAQKWDSSDQRKKVGRPRIRQVIVDRLLRFATENLMDRDSNFSDAFRTILEDADVEPERLPPKSLHLNSQIERFHLSLRSECLDRMIFFGERSLRNAVSQFILHFHGERNHQGLDNELIEPGNEIG
jgi:hypothetical protein